VVVNDQSCDAVISSVLFVKEEIYCELHIWNGVGMKKVPDELDLHGLTVDEAIPLVDRFLHQSFKAGLYRVWIIHGKGTGVLRSEVTYYLKKHPLVRHCSTADGNRGGIGAVQVEIAD
jgi:DNA-nicking Smr family endonuclease